MKLLCGKQGELYIILPEIHLKIIHYNSVLHIL